MNGINVFKFGGSCFKSEDSFNQSVKIVEHYKDQPLVIICSALYGITDQLIEYGNSIANKEENPQAPEIFLNEIKKKHLTFVEKLIDDPEIKEKLKEFIDEKINELKELGEIIQMEGFNSKNHDYLVAYGERLSAFLYSQFLNSKGYQTEFIGADKEFIITDSNFANALPLLDKTKENISRKLEPLLNKGTICVVPGYYASNEKGQITTLGRGGSDFTATIIAWVLSESAEITVIFWKDVYGILTANPKYIPDARLLKEISIKEAKELTFFGTKILHPKCLNMIERGKDITVQIRNFNDPFSEKYTTITKEAYIPKTSDKMIKAITSLDEVAMITIESDAMVDLPGTAAKIFSAIAQYGINIIFIVQGSSENNISIGVRSEDGFKVKKILTHNKYFGSHWFNIKIEHDVSVISVVGAGMVHKPGVAGILFTTLGNAGINIRAISQGSSELNITMVIARDSLKRAIKVIYNSLIEGNIPTHIARW